MDAKTVEAVVLMTGSADILPLETAMLEAVVLAETKDAANWAFLRALSGTMPRSEARDAISAAVDQVEPQEEEHIGWAVTTWQRMNLVQAQSRAAMTIASLGEKLMGKVQDATT